MTIDQPSVMSIMRKLTFDVAMKCRASGKMLVEAATMRGLTLDKSVNRGHRKPAQLVLFAAANARILV